MFTFVLLGLFVLLAIGVVIATYRFVNRHPTGEKVQPNDPRVGHESSPANVPH